MIDIRKLKELVRLMVSNDLTEVDLRDSEEQVTLRRTRAAEPPIVHVAPHLHHAPPPTVSNGSAASGSAQSADANLQPIESPMVGTYYATPEPDAPPFVQVGDRVNQNTIVCLVEAMKIFNEIKADCSGIVEEICVKSGDAVEFGETLFMVRAD